MQWQISILNSSIRYSLEISLLPTRTLDVVLPGNMHRYVLRQQVSVALLQRHLQEIFYRNAINIGLPIIECPEAAKAIEAGDEVEIDFDSGKIYDRTKGTEFKGQPFPEFMQKLIAAGGLVKYTNSKRK